MAYKVVITKEASKDIEKIDTTVKRQLYKKLIYFKEIDLRQSRESADSKIVAKKLHNHDGGEYHLRVGNFRIIFDLDKHTIVVLRVLHRKDVYR